MTALVRTPLNREEHGTVGRGQVFTMPSMTIPDQSMSLKEMMERYTRGQDLGAVAKVQLWEEEEGEQMGINPKTLDLAEIEEMKLNNADKIREIHEDYEQTRTAKQREKDRKQWEKEQEAKSSEKQAIKPVPGDDTNVDKP